MAPTISSSCSSAKPTTSSSISKATPTGRSTSAAGSTSPLADVAGMIRSFHYAAGVGPDDRSATVPQDRDRLAAWARWWQTWVSASFPAGVRRRHRACGVHAVHAAPARSALLDLLLLEHTLVRDARRSGAPAGLSMDTAGRTLVVPGGSNFEPRTTPPYSVFAGSADPCSACFSVCQASEAHLTRTGNSRTPDNTASLPTASSSTV